MTRIEQIEKQIKNLEDEYSHLIGEVGEIEEELVRLYDELDSMEFTR